MVWAIRRAATQAFAINAVSPTGLLDTLLFAGRAMRLIRDIAEIYGQRPGVGSTAHLLRRLIGGAGWWVPSISSAAYWFSNLAMPSSNGSGPAPPKAPTRRRKWRASAFLQ
jgi:hypothetical protein